MANKEIQTLKRSLIKLLESRNFPVLEKTHKLVLKCKRLDYPDEFLNNTANVLFDQCVQDYIKSVKEAKSIDDDVCNQNYYSIKANTIRFLIENLKCDGNSIIAKKRCIDAIGSIDVELVYPYAKKLLQSLNLNLYGEKEFNEIKMFLMSSIFDDTMVENYKKIIEELSKVAHLELDSSANARAIKESYKIIEFLRQAINNKNLFANMDRIGDVTRENKAPRVEEIIKKNDEIRKWSETMLAAEQEAEKVFDISFSQSNNSNSNESESIMAQYDKVKDDIQEVLDENWDKLKDRCSNELNNVSLRELVDYCKKALSEQENTSAKLDRISEKLDLLENQIEENNKITNNIKNEMISYFDSVKNEIINSNNQNQEELINQFNINIAEKLDELISTNKISKPTEQKIEEHFEVSDGLIQKLCKDNEELKTRFEHLYLLETHIFNNKNDNMWNDFDDYPCIATIGCILEGILKNEWLDKFKNTFLKSLTKGDITLGTFKTGLNALKKKRFKIKKNGDEREYEMSLNRKYSTGITDCDLKKDDTFSIIGSSVEGKVTGYDKFKNYSVDIPYLADDLLYNPMDEYAELIDKMNKKVEKVEEARNISCHYDIKKESEKCDYKYIRDILFADNCKFLQEIIDFADKIK